MRVTNTRQKWLFVLIVTASSVLASLTITAFLSPTGLSSVAFIPAVSVPLIVAPIASYVAAQMMLRIYELNARLTYLATHDQMTGLLNRGAFFERLEGLGRQRSGALMMADIDKFKSINDTFGHDVGDKVICSVAKTIHAQAGQGSVVARFGGEEFVAFCPGVVAEDAVALAELVRAAVAQQEVPLEGEVLKVTVSIGLKPMGEACDVDQALTSADQALYVAKRDGRNKVVSQAA
ncbi:GGDEF domain-containing protein [Shimia sp. R11_0]|uniref:GGDEF domain-containing protein n=1 Tax=Shimia sp. R11_0 TaxID=2821096 RepID=UPI001ADBB42F|nr:GGDEF domain-containing protein [Shimia sp. R11_0]MBO9477606.1 GGDEF domain-containing protein [Shimia sp. R11_0]